MPNRLQKMLLVVDSSETHRREMGAMIADRAHQADEAASAHDAVGLLEQFRYSVLLLDFETSRAGGHALEKYLREMPDALAPVVIVIADPGEKIEERLDVRRIHGIMRRPIDAEEIAAIALTCAELTSSRSLETMCFAMLAGTPLLAILSSRF